MTTDSQLFQTNVTGNSTVRTVDGLSPFTNYSCTVYAVILTSDGLMSDPIVVRTAEAGKDIVFLVLLRIYIFT